MMYDRERSRCLFNCSFTPRYFLRWHWIRSNARVALIFATSSGMTRDVTLFTDNCLPGRILLSETFRIAVDNCTLSRLLHGHIFGHDNDKVVARFVSRWLSLVSSRYLYTFRVFLQSWCNGKRRVTYHEKISYTRVIKFLNHMRPWLRKELLPVKRNFTFQFLQKETLFLWKIVAKVRLRCTISIFNRFLICFGTKHTLESSWGYYCLRWIGKHVIVMQMSSPKEVSKFYPRRVIYNWYSSEQGRYGTYKTFYDTASTPISIVKLVF